MIDDAAVGGGQVHVLSLAKHLDHSVFEIRIACEGTGFLVEEARRAGIPVMPVKMENRLRLHTLREVLRVLRQSQCDILHTHGGTPGFWGRVSVLIGRLPVKTVHTYHGFHYLHEGSGKARGLQMIDRWLLRTTDRVVCVCESDYEQGMQRGLVSREKGVVIHNGIETERFDKPVDREGIRRSLGIGPPHFLFGTIGRLHQQKGQMHLLAAFRSVSERHPHTRLLIVGEGELREALRQQVTMLGLDDAVILAGARKDIPELLSAMDVFVLSSLWEGQPISLLEAMAAGKPVVSTNVNGIGDILTDRKNALLVPAADIRELESAMNFLVADEVMRCGLGAAARATISESYSSRTMVRAIEAVYQSLWPRAS